MIQHNYLDAIITRKKSEVNAMVNIVDSDSNHIYHSVLNQNTVSKKQFSNSLKQNSLAIIGEIKRKSPSKGELSQINDPVELALKYCEGGISAISVLTDLVGFGGTVNDLQAVSNRLFMQKPVIPILRKDFIVHPIQLAESLMIGASSVLLIVSVLGKSLSNYIETAKRIGLEALVEIHNEDELKLAIDSGAEIIGVNHRNLNDFSMNMKLSEQLITLMPSYIVSVAESGIHTIEDAQRMKQLGYNAVLVGEALVKSDNPSQLITRMKGDRYEN